MSENNNDNIKDKHEAGGENVNSEKVDINYLLGQSLQTELELKLSSSVVGGYSKKSVEDFVFEMRNNMLQIKTQLERQIQDLVNEKASSSQECSVLRNQLIAVEDSLAETRKNASIICSYETQCDSKMEIQLYREENEKLTEMLLENQRDADQKKALEDLLKQKEQEIHEQVENIEKYKKEYDDLKQIKEDLENELRDQNNLSSDNEITELRNQKNEIIEKYQALLQQTENNGKQIDQKRHFLNDTQTKLDQQRQYLDEEQANMEKEKRCLDDKKAELEQEKQRIDGKKAELEQEEQRLDARRISLECEKQGLNETQTTLEREKQRLDETQILLKQEKQHLDETQAKLEKEKQRLADENAQLEMKEKQLKQVQAQLDIDMKSSGFEKIFEALYLYYSQLIERIKNQEEAISEKELLNESYQQQKKENYLIRQENVNLRDTLEQLKSQREELEYEIEEKKHILEDKQTKSTILYLDKNKRNIFLNDSDVDSPEEKIIKAANIS